jgi:hypothetical protein
MHNYLTRKWLFHLSQLMAGLMIAATGGFFIYGLLKYSV